MNYKGKRVAITGHDGFIGSALVKLLQEQLGAEVTALLGDIRDPQTFSVLSHEYDYLFHFGSPSSQVLFARNKEYCADVTLNGFFNAAKACKRNGIKLIYPSTGLLSQGKTNEYAMCKLICEEYADVMNVDSLGIRIFATYGPGEQRKRDYASVPYLFARDMANDKQPLIYGDGEQVRDFIYIDDVVAAIAILAESCNDPVIDVGSGQQVSFNQLVKIINVNLFAADENSYIKPKYIQSPAGYVQETLAHPSKLHLYYQPRTSIIEGMDKTLESINREEI